MKNCKECEVVWMDEDARIFVCLACGFTDSLHPSLKLHQVHACCPKANLLPGKVAEEVGMELHALLMELGSQPTSDCGCAAKAAQMNAWGIAGCREHREEIIAWLREAYSHTSLLDRLRAAGNVAVSGLTFKLDWSDPCPGLLDEALRRAEAKETK